MNVYEKKSCRNMCLKFTHDLFSMKPTTEAVVIPSSFLYKGGRLKVCRWVQLFDWKLWVRQEVLWLQTADRSSGEDRLALWSTQKTINIKAWKSTGDTWGSCPSSQLPAKWGKLSSRKMRHHPQSMKRIIKADQRVQSICQPRELKASTLKCQKGWAAPD